MGHDCEVLQFDSSVVGTIGKDVPGLGVHSDVLLEYVAPEMQDHLSAERAFEHKNRALRRFECKLEGCPDGESRPIVSDQ